MTQDYPFRMRADPPSACLALLVFAAARRRLRHRFPSVPRRRPSDLLFDAGVDYAVDDLLTQVRRLPAFNPAAEVGNRQGFSDLQRRRSPRRLAASSPWIRRSMATPDSRRSASKSLDSQIAATRRRQVHAVRRRARELGEHGQERNTCSPGR